MGEHSAGENGGVVVVLDVVAGDAGESREREGGDRGFSFEVVLLGRRGAR